MSCDYRRCVLLCVPSIHHVWRTHQTTNHTTVSSVTGLIFASGLGLDLLHTWYEVYLLCFGGIIVFMEGSTVQLNMRTRHFHYARYRRRLFYYAKFLFVPPWRGYFYLYISTMLLGQGDILDVTVGLLTLLLAGFWVYFGHTASAKLLQLKAHFPTEEAVQEAFTFAQAAFAASVAQEGGNVVDDASGYLDRSAFEVLCNDAGIHFRPVELDIGILMIDADQTGKVALHEFINWWQLDL